MFALFRNISFIFLLLQQQAFAGRMDLPSKDRDLLPSIPPGQDCNWSPFDDKRLGIKMLIQRCNDKTKQYDFYADGESIYFKPVGGKQSDNGKKIIQVFRKPSDQTISEAIKQTIITQLAGEALTSCHVRNTKDSIILLSEQVILEIVPTGDYGIKMAEEVNKGRADYGCGSYGAYKDGSKYFLYHPDEDTTKYLFVNMPENISIFDQDSIILYSLEAPSQPTVNSRPQINLHEAFEWHKYDENDTSVTYFDKSFRDATLNDKINMRILIDYKHGVSKIESNNLTQNEHLTNLPTSKIEFITIDCNAKKYKSDKTDWFNGPMGEGDRIKHFSLLSQKWVSIPKSYEKLSQDACAVKHR
jgi:hypothetical protein